jgi:ribosomal protein S18 acetylase RimI-like enzyme
MEYEIAFVFEKFLLKRIGDESKEELLALCLRCEKYYHLIEGLVPNTNTVEDILKTIPPNSKQENKYSLGIFYDTKLIGFIDFLKHYKDIDEGVIGLFLIDPNFRRMGIGTFIHKKIYQIAKEMKVSKLRIGVAENNINALKFWKKNGYIELHRRRMPIGKKEHIIIVMKTRII